VILAALRITLMRLSILCPCDPKSWPEEAVIVMAYPDAGKRAQGASAVRIGLFGGLGSGNIGNDASLEAVLGYLRAEHSDAILDAMCTGPETLRDRYGLPAIPLLWYGANAHASRAGFVLKAYGKAIDAIRTAMWVRRHDVVIVPGMGVLEASLPLRPWQLPYTMFVLCLAGRLFRTKVALVSVGARVISQRLTRWLFSSAARLAYYRSYRDVASRDAMASRGRAASTDPVYPDLVFAIPASSIEPGDARTVGIGVMAYYGTNDDDRRLAEQIHAIYVEKMKIFARRLVDDGRRIRFLVGDVNGSDESVVRELMADLRSYRPDLDPARVGAEQVASFADLMRAMEPAHVVVATRYHNVMCALRLCKPSISIGYAAKNFALMTDMGLPEYCQLLNSLDVDMLIDQLRQLEGSFDELRQKLIERNIANEQLIKNQLSELSEVLLS
jgi:polysaccharide pyruvyl transferase WcaK-like protein